MPGTVVDTGNAMERIKKLIGGGAEYLPLNIKNSDNKYNIVNTLDLVSLDLSHAEVFKFGDGMILDVIKFAFNEKDLTGRNIFKPKEATHICPLVSEEFKEMNEMNNFTGLIFKKVC